MRILVRITAHKFTSAMIGPETLAILSVENFQVSFKRFHAIHSVAFKVDLRVGEEQTASRKQTFLISPSSGTPRGLLDGKVRVGQRGYKVVPPTGRMLQLLGSRTGAYARQPIS